MVLSQACWKSGNAQASSPLLITSTAEILLESDLMKQNSAVPSIPEVQAVPANSENGSTHSATSQNFPEPAPLEGGKGGETGAINVTNADFVAAVFHSLPQNASLAVCSKKGDPTSGGWYAVPAAKIATHCLEGQNNYLNCSSFQIGEGDKIHARKETFVACHFLMLDDIGTKVPLGRLDGFLPSWLIETSPGNSQAGIILDAPITNPVEAKALLDALIAAELCDAGASGPATRWARLPVGINGKEKYADAAGKPFQCKLTQWNPHARYSARQILDGLKVPLLEVKTAKQKKESSEATTVKSVSTDGVYFPKPAENPVITQLKARGLYKSPLSEGRHDITCPWVHEHTDAVDSGTAYFEPNDQYPIGGFCCQHSHRDQYHIGQLISALDLSSTQARHKPLIRVLPGEIGKVVDAAELVLAGTGEYFQTGGLIVSLQHKHETGDVSMVPANEQTLALKLSLLADWERFDARLRGYVRCDPSPRHVSMLFKTQKLKHLSVLKGIARQPYFTDDHQLIATPGYDPNTQIYGVFDGAGFVMPEPTLEAAKAALDTLSSLQSEFRYASESDRSVALSGFLTAAVRPALPLSPAFHAQAPGIASGKSYHCELTGQFAGPGKNTKVSYPKTSEEASKVLLSALLEAPAVIEFDDMDCDWLPHGVINRVLTSEQISERILGVSRVATVNTKVLFLGSGNNVGPIRDTTRRVLTVHLDTKCETPAAIQYRHSPVDEMRNNREKYVAAALTIVQAYFQSNAKVTDAPSIASYGVWSEFCRHPLIWLGLPDPGLAFLEQIEQDPDKEILGNLLKEWWNAFGGKPTTVRKAVALAIKLAGNNDQAHLLDAILEFPVAQGDSINKSKFGWVLKKNANRIVGDMYFKAAEADGRLAWRVVNNTTKNASAEKVAADNAEVARMCADIIPAATAPSESSTPQSGIDVTLF